MSDFSTAAELTLSIGSGELRSLRQEIESALTDIPVGVEAGGVGGAGATQQPRDPRSGQFMSIEGVEQRLVNQTAILESVQEMAGGRNTLLETMADDGGEGSSRERRRRRREFRWARQRTDFAEQQVALLEDIKDNIGEGGGGGGGLLGGAGKSIGRSFMIAGGGIAAAGAGIGAGAGFPGFQAGRQIANVGTAVAGAIRDEGIPTPEVDFAPVLEPTFSPSFDPQFNPVFNPEFNPVFSPEFAPEFSPEFASPEFNPTFEPTYNTDIDVTTDLSPELNADVTFQPTLNINPSLTIDVNIASIEQELRTDLQDYTDLQVNDAQSELESEIDNLAGQIGSAIGR